MNSVHAILIDDEGEPRYKITDIIGKYYCWEWLSNGNLIYCLMCTDVFCERPDNQSSNMELNSVLCL